MVNAIFFLSSWYSSSEFPSTHHITSPGAAHIEHDTRDTKMILFFIDKKKRHVLRCELNALKTGCKDWKSQCRATNNDDAMCTLEQAIALLNRVKQKLIQYSHEYRYMCVFNVWLPLILLGKTDQFANVNFLLYSMWLY